MSSDPAVPGVTTVENATGWPPWTTHAALLVVQLAFGSNAVEGKIAMMPRDAGGAGLDPAAVAMARMAGAALAFQGGAALWRRWSRNAAASPAERRLTFADHRALALLSVLGIALNQTLFLYGLRATTPLSAALVCVTIPLLTALFAVLVGHERLSWRLGVGTALAAGGVMLLTGVGRPDRGAVLVILNSMSYAGYIVLGRAVIRRLGTMTVMRWAFTWGALMFAPMGVVPLLRELSHPSPLGVLLLVYLVLVPTVLAYVANAWALGRSSATLVTGYIYLQPLIAGGLAYAQLGLRPAGSAIVAGALIVVGVSVVASRRAAHAHTAPEPEPSHRGDAR